MAPLLGDRRGNQIEQEDAIYCVTHATFTIHDAPAQIFMDFDTLYDTVLSNPN